MVDDISPEDLLPLPFLALEYNEVFFQKNCYTKLCIPSFLTFEYVNGKFADK